MSSDQMVTPQRAAAQAWLRYLLCACSDRVEQIRWLDELFSLEAKSCF